MIDIKDFLQYINMDESQIDMTYGLKKTSDGYEILTRTGEYRTYSDNGPFEGGYNLSKIKDSISGSEKIFRDIKFTDSKGRNKEYKIVEHKNSKGISKGFSSDMEGNNPVPKA